MRRFDGRRRRKRPRSVIVLLAVSLLAFLLPAAASGCGAGGTGTTGTPSSQVSATTASTATSGSGNTQGPSVTIPQVSSATTTTTAATTTSAVSSTTTAGGELSSAETRLPNGHVRAMGFISRVWVDASGRHLEIDYAEMLTGAAADAAAVAAGVIKLGEHIENDYFITNVNPLLRTFAVSQSVGILDDTGVTGVPITWESFMAFWTGDPAGAAHKRAAPWWIERDGDTVVQINQQYLP